MSTGQFVVATPQRTVCDEYARALDRAGRLRFIALGTRRGARNIPPERTRLKPAIGLVNYLCARSLSADAGEWCRFALLPWFDRWVRPQLVPGDHLISSYGYATESFRRVREQGGKTFLDAGNSHIDNFWEVMTEEHRRWQWPHPPFARHWLRRARESIALTDYVLSPSRWVTESFLARGFPAERILPTVYVVDLSQFTPAAEPRPPERPLTVISTGQLSLRKGTPYLLEAFRLILRAEPGARLLLTENLANNAKPILERYRDLPIDWSPGLPHPQLAERLRSADVFVLPSLEEGAARTVTEAMACGLPVVVTHQTGSADLVRPGVSGTIVPIRDPEAIAAAVLEWWEQLCERREPPARLFDAAQLSFEPFAANFLAQLGAHGML
jgi:glycosyltransferase involved in cell wall biosynthesis